MSTQQSDPESSSTFSGESMKEAKNLKNQKPPSYLPELTLFMLNMFLLKFYSETFFDAMSFFNLGVPFMLYLICTLFSNLLEFIKQILLEDMAGSENDQE